MRHHRVALLVVVWTVVAAGPLHAQSERPGTRVWLSLGLALEPQKIGGRPAAATSHIHNGHKPKEHSQRKNAGGYEQ